MLPGSASERVEQAASPGDGSPLVQQVSDHFGGGDRGEDAVYEGHVSEKEVHGIRKCGTEGDGDDNEQVGQHSEKEHEQKDNEEYFLQVWILCESQEDKFSHIVKRREIHLETNTVLWLELPERKNE